MNSGRIKRESQGLTIQALSSVVKLFFKYFNPYFLKNRKEGRK